MGVQHEIRRRVHQRMSGMDEFRHRLAVDPLMLPLETDALVLAQHRGASLADHPVSLTDARRHVPDLVASGFPRTHFATEALKASEKKRA
jgi:hypothetical protein